MQIEEYNLNDLQQDLEYTEADILKLPEVVEVVIVGMKLVSSKEAFGDKARDEDQKLIYVEFENTKYGIKFHEYFNYYKKRWVPENSKLGKYLLAYKELKLGAKAKAVKKEYWEVLL